MKRSEVVSERLHNQKLSLPGFKRPVDVVRWLGAVQAQDYNAAKWALALRMVQATDAVIENAFNEGQIIRTHVMRPTWHFVAPDDIRWLLQLTAPRVNSRCGPNYRRYGLDTATFNRANKALTKALQGGKHLTRSALKAVLNKAGVEADDTVRLAHILLRAELDATVCSGPRIGKQFTYALLDERVPATRVLPRDEALAELTRRYFTSHGPATLHDFIWWSGLTAADARHGIALIERDIREAVVDDKVYWSSRSGSAVTRSSKHSAHLLPAYDEYFVAYKDRQLGLDRNPSMTTWGLLGPTVIVDGSPVGAWKCTIEKRRVTIALKPSRVLTKPQTTAITSAAERYATFLGLPAQIS